MVSDSHVSFLSNLLLGEMPVSSYLIQTIILLRATAFYVWQFSVAVHLVSLIIACKEIPIVHCIDQCQHHPARSRNYLDSSVVEQWARTHKNLGSNFGHGGFPLWTLHLYPSLKQKQALLWGGELRLMRSWCSMLSCNWSKMHKYSAWWPYHNIEDVIGERIFLHVDGTIIDRSVTRMRFILSLYLLMRMHWQRVSLMASSAGISKLSCPEKARLSQCHCHQVYIYHEHILLCAIYVYPVSIAGPC